MNSIGFFSADISDDTEDPDYRGPNYIYLLSDGLFIANSDYKYRAEKFYEDLISFFTWNKNLDLTEDSLMTSYKIGEDTYYEDANVL